MSIRETCTVCSNEFDVQFRYQMEERDGGFWFFCSQKCLEASQRGEAGHGHVACDACHKQFRPELAAQVFYVGGRRRYACGLACRAQLTEEAKGTRLGELSAPRVEARRPEPPPAPRPAERAERTTERRDAPRDAEPSASALPRVFAAPTPSAPSGPSPSSAQAASTHGAREARADATAPAGSVVSLSPEPRRGARDGAREASRGLPRVVAVFNHKGGTGKTTTAVSLASGLAARGKRVLLVDTDAQGNVAVSLGASAERSLYHVLVMGLRASDAVKTVRPGLDLLPSNETLAAAELYLAGRQNRDRVLSERLASASRDYDFVIVDCSPSLSLMNQNALVFADSVLVPVGCDYLSLVGVRQVIKTVKSVNSVLHHPVQIWGVLPTFFDSRAKICREAVATMKEHFGARCLPPVRANIKVKEAPAQGQTIFEYAAGSHAAEDYLALCDRVLDARSASERHEPKAVAG